ncbi:hypothetical protein [Streptomyces virginiae]|uniref:hypothetical protein n=1 Tax=Streptomyces virginiae TaxID=1961 RepID=UPI0036C7E1C8
MEPPGRGAAQDLAWWQLRDSLGLPSRILAVVLACSLVTALADWLVFPAKNLAAGRGAAFALGTGLLDALLFGPAVGLAFGLVHGLMSVPGIRAFEPSRVRIRLPGRRGRGVGPSSRRFATLVPAGVLGGSVMGLGCGLAFTVGAQLTYGGVVVDAAVIEATAVNCLMYGLVFALAGGLVLGLVAALETPIDLGSAATPTDLPAVNRSVVVRQALLLAPMLTLVIAFGGRLMTELLQGVVGSLTWPMADGRRARARCRGWGGRRALLRLGVHRLGPVGAPDPDLAAADRPPALGDGRLPGGRLPARCPASGRRRLPVPSCAPPASSARRAHQPGGHPPGAPHVVPGGRFGPVSVAQQVRGHSRRGPGHREVDRRLRAAPLVGLGRPERVVAGRGRTRPPAVPGRRSGAAGGTRRS